MRTSNVSLHEVHVSGSLGVGVFMDYAESVTIATSNILNNHNHGITIDHSSNITIQSSHIRMSDSAEKACGIDSGSGVDSLSLHEVEILGAPRAGICSLGTNLFLNSSQIINNEGAKSACFAVPDKKQIGFANSSCDVISQRAFE